MDQDEFMKTIQKAAQAETNQMSAEAGQVTVGELIAKLESAPKKLAIILSDGNSPGVYSSYRGYYDHIAIEPGDEPTTVKDFLKATKEVVGKTYMGYKGGDYTMTKHTPVWVSAYGDYTGHGIVDLRVEKDKVVLIVKDIEELG